MNKLLMIDEKIKNSKMKISRNFLYYVIAPVVIFLVGIILLATVGFNGGTDFRSSSTFTIYANAEGAYAQPAAQYQLDKESEFNAFCDKIEAILDEEGLTVETIQKTKMDINDNGVIQMGGQAVKVTFLNNSSSKDKINAKNDALKTKLLSSFGYSDEAIAGVDFVNSTLDFTWLSWLLSAIVVGLLVAIAYLAIRNRSWAMFVNGLLTIAFDIVITFGLIIICRVPVNMTISAVVLATIVMSFINVFLYSNKAQDNIMNGKFVRMDNSDMADATVKELAFKKIIVYICMIVMALLFIICATRGVRFVALGILISVFSTFYTSNFILPAIWSATYKYKKRKKKI